MKKIIYCLICLMTIFVVSCSKDDTLLVPDSEEDAMLDPDNVEIISTLPWVKWGRIIGQRFTKETSPHFWEILTYIENEDLEDGEYVEFYNLTDSCITIRYAREDKKIVDLSEVTNHQISGKIASPNLPFSFLQSMETKLQFNYEDKTSYCYFEGHTNEPYNFFTKFTGHLDSIGNLHIRKLGGYISPFPKLRLESSVAFDYPYQKFYRNWQVPFYKFDTAALKCRQSPILIHWNSTAWKGEISTIIPDITDFLQLLLAVPVLDTSEYGYKFAGDFMSIERLICLKFPGVEQYSPVEYNKNGWPTGSYSWDTIMEYGESYKDKNYVSSLVVSKINDQTMCVRMDTDFIFNRFDRNKERLFFANIMRSLLSDDKFYFEMQYKLIDCDFNDKSREREFHMTLTDPQHSRNIMEYVILPLIIENKQAIKDYIRHDAELSQHADVLCSAVDRLEEIYAGTTDLTLGYRLVEHQWHRRYKRPCDLRSDIWKEPEFE